MQKHVNLVDLVKSFPMNIYLQNLASIEKRTSPLKFAHLAEKSGNGSIPNLSTKSGTLCACHQCGEEDRASREVRPPKLPEEKEVSEGTVHRGSTNSVQLRPLRAPRLDIDG